ncbi:reverse transcriptase family protein [Frondihabitans cladoniiphilus]|uniref:RNA-directed DNA polymerase n=1 Tax=Frondihabitans cladoniiphilus TaxID=715785 RepID=A0ABP8VHX6_9MICO
MRRLPGEADDAGSASSSPGLPRGTKIDQATTPQEANRASHGTPPAPTDESPGSRLQARSVHPTPPHVAAALADAFLAAPSWNASGLREAAAVCLGGPRRFVVPVVGHVLRAHHRPPRDAPRELSRRILDSPGFAEAVERSARRLPLTIASWRVEPPSSRNPDDRGMLGLATVTDLARALGTDSSRLAWFADTKLWNRRAPAGPLHHYRYEWRARPGRVPRLLEVPQGLLKGMQRTVLDELLDRLPLNDAAHGFVPGRSAVTGAALHTGQEVVIGLDLVSFFARVPARKVYSVFRQAGLPEAVAHTLTGLCTHSVPPRILSLMPPGGSPDERFALRRALALPHLPQGSPTSPMLANLAVRRLDSRLAGWATSVGAVYTRYADDLAFSGGSALASRVDAFVRGVDRIVTDEGYSLNVRKTRVRRRGVRQTVTGIVVNETTGFGRREYDAVKAELHNCVVKGPGTQDARGHPDYRAHLLGRIAWVTALNPGRGARLRREFDRIRW